MNEIPHRIGIDARLWNETGVGRYIRNLVWEIAKLDKVNQYILFFNDNEYKNVQLPGENFQKVLADIHWHSIQEQLVLPSIFTKENLDILHFPYFSLPILYTKPFVLTIHDLILNHYPTGQASTRWKPFYWSKQLAYRFITSLAVKKAKKIIAVSQATKKEITQHYSVSPAKIAVIYEGVDTKITSHEIENLKNDMKYFLYVGNAYPHKNLEFLLAGFAEFRKRQKSKTKLILVGKEDYFYKKLKAFVRKHDLSDTILFYEKVSDAGLAELYQHALALVAPSLMEGFGLPLLEAMSFGTRILASRIEAFQEICQDSAIYFDPYDINNLVDILLAIAKGEIQDSAKQREKRKILARSFSWEKMAQETLNIYESCISLR